MTWTSWQKNKNIFWLFYSAKDLKDTIVNLTSTKRSLLSTVTLLHATYCPWKHYTKPWWKDSFQYMQIVFQLFLLTGINSQYLNYTFTGYSKILRYYMWKLFQKMFLVLNQFFVLKHANCLNDFMIYKCSVSQRIFNNTQFDESWRNLFFACVSEFFDFKTRQNNFKTF